MIKLIQLLLLCLLLSACSSVPFMNSSAPSPAPEPETSPWETRKARLEKLQDWDLTGRIAIKEGSQGWQASVRWQQQGDRYVIDLIGPFGQGQVKISGNPSGVQLRQGNSIIDADDPDSLLERATGTRLPVAGLYYWIRGIPVPETTSKITFDPQARAVRIEQNGWVIEYPNYIDVDSPASPANQALQLPKRINAQQDDLTIKIIVQTWGLASAS